MARRGPYRIHTTEDTGREMTFHTVAGSEGEAERTFRKLHPRWRRPLNIEPPAFPEATKKKKGVK